MNVSLVMTILGADKPGLVESVAAKIAENGGNWLESRMSHLAGQFAGILRVEVANDEADRLVAALRTLDDEGLQLIIHSDAGDLPSVTKQLVHLELVGHDRPGIVRQITKALADHDVNVEELNTECTTAAMTGDILFRADAKLLLPSEGSIDALRHELERIATDLMVDIVVE